MKKSFFLGLTLAMLSSSALAYTNDYAGYSIKNEDALETQVEAARFYAYTSYPQTEQAKVQHQKTVHVIGYFTAEEMEQVTGVPFSTEYFNQQYENLALLGRCELDLRTVPVAMLDLANYTDIQEQNIYARLLLPREEVPTAEQETTAEAAVPAEAEARAVSQQAQEAQAQKESAFEPWVRVDKLGKHKAITISQYYHQEVKREEQIVVAHTSLLSKDDQLYVLTTYHYENSTPESKKLERKYFKQSLAEKYPELGTAKEQQKLVPFASMDKEELNEKFSAELWQEHCQLVENFQYVEPKAAVQQLRFYDPLVKRHFDLPQDWFYVQVKDEEQDSQDNLLLAASYPKFVQLFEQEATSDVVRFLEKTLLSLHSDKSPLTDLTKEDLLKLTQGLDEVLVGASFAIEDEDLAALLANPQETKAELESFLRQGMDRLHNMENGLYRIYGYGYETDFTRTKAVADLDVHANLLDTYEFTNQIRFACQKDKGLLLWYLKTKNLPANEKLAEQIQAWQF